jgi:hypothetical protein
MGLQLGKLFDRALIAVLVVQLMGCGTLLYPERKGQKAGHVDVGVFLLDAVGLLFFLIPGIIAFAVDFSNGTIYVPGTATTTTTHAQLRQIKFDPKTTTVAQIEKIIKDQTGYAVKLNQSNIKVSRLSSNDDMMAHFAQALPDIESSRLAYNR